MRLVFCAPSRKKEGLRMSAMVMADVLRSMQECMKAYQTDIVHDILALDKRIRQSPATQDEVEIYALGIREYGVDAGELITCRTDGADAHRVYPGGIYRFTMQTDPDSPDGGIILRVYKEGTP